MKIFLFDNGLNRVVINEPEILLIREFSALWTDERNITKEDPKGHLKTRAFRELTYIWLMLDGNSPYFTYSEQERHSQCILDAKLTEEEWSDPTFRAACRKYRELQDSSIALQFLKSAQNVVFKIKDYFDTLDLQERDPMGKPILKTKDVIAELDSADKALEALKRYEANYRQELEAKTNIRGDVDVGFANRVYGKR